MTTDQEISEPRNIGKEICAALGLDAENLNTMTIEPADGGDLIVTTTSTVYLSGYSDPDDQRADALIDRLKQYRLVPITDNDTRPVNP